MSENKPVMIICDDNPRERQHLANVLGCYQPRVMARASEALSACEGLTEPWLVTDIQMPETNGIELARQVWEQYSHARIIFWSQHSDETYVRALSRLIPPETVYGYVLKTNSDEVLLRAASAVFEDCQCWIDPLIRQVQARSQHHSDALSDAEYEVLIDIALGLTDNAIAERRYLSRRGVQNRLHSLYAKLGNGLVTEMDSDLNDLMNARLRAVSIALQRGLINNFELAKAEEDLKDWLSRK